MSDLDCNDLQVAIIRKSRAEVEKLLSSKPYTISYKNAFGQTPLHIAADWPWALALLLSRGADPNVADERGYLPIAYACLVENCEAIELLFAKDSLMIGKLPDEESNYSLLELCHYCGKLDVFRLVVFELGRRRRQLLRKAQDILPRSFLDSLLPPEEKLPDCNAQTLIRHVCLADQSLNPLYYHPTVESRGVYHAIWIHEQQAEILFEAGFTYLEGQDADGQTPLAMCSQRYDCSDMDLWLVQKGVSLERSVNIRGRSSEYSHTAPSVHWVMIKLAVQLSWSLDNEAKLYDECNKFLETIHVCLRGGVTGCFDHCECCCSHSGCDPSNLLLKALANRTPTTYRYAKYGLTWFSRCIDIILHIALARSTSQLKEQFGAAAVRLTLFMDLGMKHVCCFPELAAIKPPLCKDEADEVREEDEYLIGKFEDLLPKAQEEWKETSKPFSEFWRDFHKTYISRRAQNDTEYDAFQLSELGVRLEEIESDDEVPTNFRGARTRR